MARSKFIFVIKNNIDIENREKLELRLIKMFFYFWLNKILQTSEI